MQSCRQPKNSCYAFAPIAKLTCVRERGRPKNFRWLFLSWSIEQFSIKAGTAGPNNVGSSCIRLYTTANTDATTPNIVGPTILGVVRSFALSWTVPFLFYEPIRSHSSVGLIKVASDMKAASHGLLCPLISYPHPHLLLFDAAVAVFVVSRMSVELSSPTDPLLGSTQSLPLDPFLKVGKDRRSPLNGPKLSDGCRSRSYRGCFINIRRSVDRPPA